MIEGVKVVSFLNVENKKTISKCSSNKILKILKHKSYDIRMTKSSQVIDFAA